MNVQTDATMFGPLRGNRQFAFPEAPPADWRQVCSCKSAEEMQAKISALCDGPNPIASMDNLRVVGQSAVGYTLYAHCYNFPGAAAFLAGFVAAIDRRAAPHWLALLDEAFGALTQLWDEDCRCYDEVDPHPGTSVPVGICLACRIREAVQQARG